jgi:AAHS family 4-hydroxybenzoate transporter-like MFS transporter
MVRLIILLIALGGADGAPSQGRSWVVILSIAGIGIFVSICMAAGYALITLGYPEAVRSTGLGIALMIGRMGGVLTGLTGGLLLSLAGDESGPLLATLIALTVVIFGAGLIVNRHIAMRERAR